MRRAICTSDIQLHVLGSKGSVNIGRGTEVDLDQVIGETGDGAAATPTTLGDALGPHVAHFDVVVARPSRRPHGTEE